MLLWNDALTEQAGKIEEVLKGALRAEDGPRAMEWGWQALELEPMRPERYFLLATVNDETGGPSAVGAQLRAMGLTVMQAQTAIREPQRMLLARAFPEWRGDWGDPGRMDDEARLLRRQRAHELRLEPLGRLRDFLDGLRLGMDAGTLERTAKGQTAAARDAARPESGVDPAVTALLVATVGETGPAELLPELLVLAAEAGEPVAGHAEWAASRIARRFPKVAASRLAGAARGASAAVQGRVVDQLAAVEGGVETLAALGQGLGEMATEPAAGYLAVAVERALRRKGAQTEALAVRSLALRTLSGKAQAEYEMYLAMGDLFQPQVNPAELGKRTLADVVLGRGLLEGRAPVETASPDPFRREGPKVGRNDPCWCGSGKKYKKCHLDKDEGR
jgi:hypothetical protein